MSMTMMNVEFKLTVHFSITNLISIVRRAFHVVNELFVDPKKRWNFEVLLEGGKLIQ